MSMRMPLHEFGKYGGRVLRMFKADVPWMEGAEISAEQAAKWPMSNRKALFELHKVEWYGPPEDAEKRLEAANKVTIPKEVKEKKEVKVKEVKEKKEAKVKEVKEKKVKEVKSPAVHKSSRTK